jgi:hypothetical protein
LTQVEVGNLDCFLSKARRTGGRKASEIDGLIETRKAGLVKHIAPKGTATPKNIPHLIV